MNKTQEIILGIYKEVAEVCEKYKIPYFAIGGTAIGAVRHHGFVPWDDDLDIAVPVEDYRRFIGLLATELSDNYLVWPNSKHDLWCNIFVKVIDKRTTAIESYRRDRPEGYTGIWIDVMPMAGVPISSFSQKLFYLKFRLYRLLNSRLQERITDCHSVRVKALQIISAPLRVFMQPDDIRSSWLSFLENYPLSTSELTGYTWSRNLPKLIFPKEWFSDYVLMPFEGTLMRMPIGYHEYLSQQFGDYMAYPPEEQRFGHSVFVDVEHSYKDYQSGKLSIPSGYFD